MSVSCDHHCVIEKLLQTLFSSLSYNYKLNLNLHTKIKTCTRHFNTSLYEDILWLCGCDKLNKLFCWPCLLFPKEKHVFNSAGYSDNNNVYKPDRKHRHSVNHIACLKETTLFGNNSRIEFSLSCQYRQSIENTMRQLHKTGKL
jgi:hypothetical protein